MHAIFQDEPSHALGHEFDNFFILVVNDVASSRFPEKLSMP